MNNFKSFRSAGAVMAGLIFLYLSTAFLSGAGDALPPSVVEKATSEGQKAVDEKEKNAQEAVDRIKAASKALEEQKNVEEDAPSTTGADSREKDDLLVNKQSGKKITAYVVPVHEGITGTTEYIMRRAIKSAIEEEIDTVILDIDTPGGRLDVTLEIMEMLDRFEGDTIAYVNEEAISAGAIISVSNDYIYLSPKGVIGAAAAVQATGEDIPETMKLKIYSYMDAKIRTISEEEEHPYRAKVVKKMMDADYELVIEGEVIKEKGELLTLTANEAMKKYGDPPTPLFGDGIAESVDELLEMQYAGSTFEVTDFEITWSEKFAAFMDGGMRALLIVVGIVLLYLEAQTPTFGIFGTAGVVVIAFVILSGFAAGLAGHEPLILFFIGILLIIFEIFFIPGTVIFAVTGALCILASLAWSMTDIWPTSTGGFEIEWDTLMWGFTVTVFCFFVALAVIMVLWKILHVTGLEARLVHSGTTAAPSVVTAGGGSLEAGQDKLPDVGSRGIVTRDLHPLGQVEIDNQSYEATVNVGTLERGEPIIVVGYKHFSLLVKKDKQSE